MATTKTIDLVTTLKPEKAVAGAGRVTRSLKDIQDQANKTRESMAKMTEVGAKLALVGGAIVAPFALAMNKYVATMKNTEPAAKRITELSKKWEESQVRLGRVTAQIVLPALEKGAQILEGVISFAEKNPGVVQAALTIGSTLVILGGLIATTAQLVSTIATIQGLAATAGIAMGGGGALTGAAAGAGGAGLATLIGTAMTAAAPVIITLLIAALVGAVVIPIVQGITNAIMGTNYTLKDLAVIAGKFFWLLGYGFGTILPNALYRMGESIGRWIGEAFASFTSWIKSVFGGGKASGGYMDKPAFYLGGERGREFVLNANTTKNAERAIGGRLNQQSAGAIMTNNIQVGNGMTISQTRRMIRESELGQLQSFVGAFG